MDNRPIGVCDSGIGGIVVLSEIIKLLPNEKFIYLGDTGRFPYGTKSKETLVRYTKESVEFLISKNVKAIVIACGTASSVLAEVLKENYGVPIIGVFKPTVLGISKSDKKIGIIATSRTIASKEWDVMIKQVHPNKEIVDKACPILAPLAEAGWTDNEVAKLTIKEYLNPFKNSDISELILGCTHYPLFKNLIEKELKDVKLIDIGEETATYLEKYFKENNMLNEDELDTTYEFNFTDMDDSYVKTINTLLKGVSEIETKDVKKVQL
ncbi:MAG: glutamate racemase [Oscillospiraceae bacterium]|nr:glutamate racemase [Oscillospiraceae bacterium]